MNKIVIELCAEDRARIDRLAAAMELRCAQVENYIAERSRKDEPETAGLDEVQARLAEAVAKASDPVPAPADTHPVDTPWEEPAPTYTPDPEAAPAPVKVPSLEEFQKALTLRCAESEETKSKVRALLHEYAPAASRVPEEKRAEVLERLANI